MPYWARLIRNGGAWAIPTETPRDQLPSEAVSDLMDKNGRLSVWLVNDLDESIIRLATALQPNDKNKDFVRSMTFRVIDTVRLSELGVAGPAKSTGDSLDREPNENFHYEIDVTSIGTILSLVAALLENDPIVVREPQMTSDLHNAILIGRVELKKLSRNICEKLVAYNKLVAYEEDRSADNNPEPPSQGTRFSGTGEKAT